MSTSPRGERLTGVNASMLRPHLIVFMLVLICVRSTLASQPASSPEARRPNVLFLAVDDMNDSLNCLSGELRAITPNIDRLAARGTVFTNAHTAGVFCAPSRAAIFSGQFASTTGCYNDATYFVDHPDLQPLQVSFSQAGYTTLGAGKLFHHPEGNIDTRGWTEFFLRSPEQRRSGWPLDSWNADTPFPEPFPNSVYNYGKEITGGLFLEWAALPNDREDEMADTQRVAWAVEQLKQHHSEPFFLGVGLYAPHYPNYCPQKYFDLYDRDAIEPPLFKEGDLDDLPERIRKAKTNRSQILRTLDQLDAVKDAIHGYLACMSYADAMLGRVLDALEASPYADNTVVVLWSDHGYHHGEKGHWGKHTLWDRTSRVPFIWAGPGVAAGHHATNTVSLIDIYPTLVEMCDLPTPPQPLEGRSLASTLRDPTSTLRAPTSGEDRHVLLPGLEPGEYALITNQWRYIHYNDGEELYDRQADPHEWTNLAASANYAAVKEQLRQHAPRTFAPSVEKRNARRDLVITGDTFHWERGQGNYVPAAKHLPYTVMPTTDSPDAPGKQPNTGSASPAKSGPPPKHARTPKNLLLIVCDDLNGHISPTGYAPIHTPTLEQFAASAITFQRAYCQYPVCGPSRASLLTGLYPESTGVLNNTDDVRTTRNSATLLPGYLQDHGYWTASVGKVFHSSRQEPGDDVWDEHLRFENDELPVVTKAREAFEQEHGSVTLPANRQAWRTIEKATSGPLTAQTPPGFGRSGLTDAQHKDGKNARQVAAWLHDNAPGDKPFFIACGIQKPHVPFLAPDAYFDRYPTDELVYTPDRPNLWDSLPASALSRRYEAFGFELGVEDDARRRAYMQAYHACISFLDAQLKLVFDALEASGHRDDTIVIFTSDHGYHLGDHFLWGKVTLFEVGTRVPLIVRVPGLTQPGTSSQALVELVDLFPTIVDLVGVPPPDSLQGVSMRPLLGHPERLGRKTAAYTVVSRGQHLGAAVRTQRWRYARWPDGEELYNLANDPHEKRNLAGKPHVEERLREMRLLLEERQAAAQGD